jgi:hypothetical protein
MFDRAAGAAWRVGAAPYVDIAVLTALATLLQDVTSVSGAPSQLRNSSASLALTTRIFHSAEGFLELRCGRIVHLAVGLHCRQQRLISAREIGPRPGFGHGGEGAVHAAVIALIGQCFGFRTVAVGHRVERQSSASRSNRRRFFCSLMIRRRSRSSASWLSLRSRSNDKYFMAWRNHWPQILYATAPPLLSSNGCIEFRIRASGDGHEQFRLCANAGLKPVPRFVPPACRKPQRCGLMAPCPSSPAAATPNAPIAGTSITVTSMSARSPSALASPMMRIRGDGLAASTQARIRASIIEVGDVAPRRGPDYV